MDKLFLQIINMSITSSYVILFIILIRFFLKRVPKVYSYSLWFVALFRLIFPFSFNSVFSLIPMGTTTIPVDIVYASTPQIHSGITAIDGIVNNSLPAPVTDASINPIQIWIYLGQIIWLFGILVLITYSILMSIQLTKKLKLSKLLRDNIYEIKDIETPFVFGILNPKIYLPFGFSETEQSYIIKHEETHIKRFDHIIKFFSFLVATIHWFNPLVWIAFFLMSKDMELSCDEKVITKMGNGIKKDYSKSLLSLSTRKRMIGGSPLAFGGRNTKQRIKNILSYKKPRFWATLVGIIVIIGAVMGLLSNPKEKISRTPGIEDLLTREDYADREEPSDDRIYDKISAYMEEESKSAFSPYYELLDFEISNYHEEVVGKSVEASFYYKIIHKNFDKDPDTVGYIKEAKENESNHYQQMYDEYLASKEMNFDLKVIINENDLITLYSNVSPNGVKWEETKMSDYILQKTEVTDTQDQSSKKLVSFEGLIAIITEDVVMENPYVITADSENTSVYQKMDNTKFSLNKNDLVIVIEEDDAQCRIMQVSGDIPAIRGTVPRNKLSYDTLLFMGNANQIIVDNGMGYDEIDGNEIGIEYGRGIVLERKDGWVRVSLPMQESNLWFKSDSLSYEFDTSVIDIEQ